MHRLKRRIRTDIDLGIVNPAHTLPDLIDNLIKSMYRVNDAEYDYIAEFATEDQLDVLCQDLSIDMPFSKRREIVQTLNDLLSEYENQVVILE